MFSSSKTPLSRRHFISTAVAIAGTLTGAGSLLGACSTNGQQAGTTTITMMYTDGEFPKTERDLFEKQNPGYKITFLNFDQVRLNAMFAAGNPPDIIRTQGAPEMPNIIARGLALDLTSYFDKSSVLKVDDLQGVNDVYRWDGHTQGKGPRYGMAKDWSQDVMLWYNKQLFDQAGVPYPSETEPLTYDELLNLGKKLTVRENGKIKVYGLATEYGGFTTQSHLIQMVAQQGASLWNNDYTQINLTSPEARKALQWYVDWAQAHVGPSPLDPDSGWEGSLFPAGRIAMHTWGYWFGGLLASDTTGFIDHVGFAPAPQFGSQHISACMAGTGAWIPKVCKNPDAAWKLFEYFMGEKPALDRVSTGYGLPALKHLMEKLPQQKAYQKQAFQVEERELNALQVLHYSPYVSDSAMETAIQKALLPVMQGQQTLDQGIAQLQDSVNLLLQQGKGQVG